QPEALWNKSQIALPEDLKPHDHGLMDPAVKAANAQTRSDAALMLIQDILYQSSKSLKDFPNIPLLV
ncbi:hypothetical protein BGZ98_004957, partial [Dissophora globulifera]